MRISAPTAPPPASSGKPQLSTAQQHELAAIQARHADRLAWLSTTGTRGYLHEITDDIQALIDMLAPPPKPALRTLTAAPKPLVMHKLPLRKPT